jgi:hypothetical protein
MRVVLQIVAVINERSYLQQQQDIGPMSSWSTANGAHNGATSRPHAQPPIMRSGHSSLHSG